MTRQAYRGFWIAYEPKPIPAWCGVDWSWWHADYDGPGDRRCGTSKSFEAAQAEIDALLEELAP